MISRKGYTRMLNSITTREEGYRTLACAVVYQAYCDLVDFYSERPCMMTQIHGMEALRFIRSGRFCLYSDIDSDMIIKQAREEAAKIKKRRP